MALGSIENNLATTRSAAKLAREYLARDKERAAPPYEIKVFVRKAGSPQEHLSNHLTRALEGRIDEIMTEALERLRREEDRHREELLRVLAIILKGSE